MYTVPRIVAEEGYGPIFETKNEPIELNHILY